MKKTFASLILVAALSSLSFAPDWRMEVAALFDSARPDDYRAARQYLSDIFASLPEEDKPAACGLQAFLANRLGDKTSEYDRLGNYFERYGALGLGFSFLPPGARGDVARYLRDWQLRYPYVVKIGIITSSVITVAASPNPPESLLLGVEMANDAFYKLSDGQGVLEGGLFRRGFNAVRLPAGRLFAEPGTFSYYLEFKSGDFVVQREIALNIEMSSAGVVPKPAAPGRIPEFVLEIYLGEKLLASSRKSPPTVPPGMGIEVPPPSGVYDPFGEGYQNKPEIPQGVPIFAIPTVISELIKGLKKKDEVEPVPPVEIRTDMAYAFTRKNAAGKEIEIRASLALSQKSVQFLPLSAAGGPPDQR
jgi:hypothetical protein